MIRIDPLRLARRLVETGMPERQGEGLAAALGEAVSDIVPRVDSLRLAQRLRDAGWPGMQSEAIAAVLEQHLREAGVDK
jgi:hypothetical protein